MVACTWHEHFASQRLVFNDRLFGLQIEVIQSVDQVVEFVSFSAG